MPPAPSARRAASAAPLLKMAILLCHLRLSFGGGWRSMGALLIFYYLKNLHQSLIYPIFASRLTYILYIMAKGNLLQGQGAGKVGDLVFMVRQGVQVSRVYTKAGARSGVSASEASRIQRVRFGAASNQWSLYRYVCTRMFRKGKAGNLSDYNYFVKRNQALLPYLTKAENAAGVHCLMPGQLSEGNLGRIECVSALSYTQATGKSTLSLADAQHKGVQGIAWNSNLSVLKAAYKRIYPAASKVTFLFSFAPVLLEQSEGEEYQSQTIQHTAVTIDLYRESTAGENDMTVAAFLSAAFTDSDLATLIAGQTETFGGVNMLCIIRGTSEEDWDLISNLTVTLFATDDNASDCYTTIIPADGVPVTMGAYALYASYRTTDALRVACESYGYQSGVMRDDIAKFGNSLQQQQQAYAARLRSVGLDIESAEE